MTRDEVLKNTGEPRGSHDRHGNVTITFNSQGWILNAPRAPGGEHLKWMPCEHCGAIRAVPLNVVSCHCDNECASARGYERVPGGERECDYETSNPHMSAAHSEQMHRGMQ